MNNNPDRTGTRFCALCQKWQPEKTFALSALSHDGYHPLCLLHVSQEVADVRAGAAREQLRRARVSPISPIDYTLPPSVVTQSVGTTARYGPKSS